MMSEADYSFENTAELVECLDACALSEAIAATAALTMRGAGVVRRTGGLKASALMIAYARRRVFLATFTSEYAIRLRNAIAELVDNLRPLGGHAVDVFNIGTRDELHFVVFRASRHGQVLGCLPHVNGLRLRPEQWQALWGYS